MTNNPIDVDFMRHRFYYDPELYQLFYRYRVSNKVKGDRAGKLKDGGYRIIRIKCTEYYEHRIIYAIVTGRDPVDKHIHHINGVKDHNDFYNLQALTHAEHASEHRESSFLEIHPLDRQPSKNNTSGIKGVHWDKYKKRWRIKITFGGKPRYLGRCKDLETARIKIINAWEEYQASQR